MNRLGVTVESATLELTRDEIYLIGNALNEICNGIDISEFEFHARLGVDLPEAKKLLAQFWLLWEDHYRRTN